MKISFVVKLARNLSFNLNPPCSTPHNPCFANFRGSTLPPEYAPVTRICTQRAICYQEKINLTKVTEQCINTWYLQTWQQLGLCTQIILMPKFTISAITALIFFNKFKGDKQASQLFYMNVEYNMLGCNVMAETRSIQSVIWYATWHTASQSIWESGDAL